VLITLRHLHPACCTESSGRFHRFFDKGAQITATRKLILSLFVIFVKRAVTYQMPNCSIRSEGDLAGTHKHRKE